MLDLCTYLGVKENEEFKIDGYPYKYKVKDNTLYQSYDKNIIFLHFQLIV